MEILIILAIIIGIPIICFSIHVIAGIVSLIVYALIIDAIFEKPVFSIIAMFVIRLSLLISFIVLIAFAIIWVVNENRTILSFFDGGIEGIFYNSKTLWLHTSQKFILFLENILA